MNTKLNKNGEPKKKSGYKASDESGARRSVTFSVNPKEIETLEKIGEGNRSKGLQKAILLLPKNQQQA